jgi:bla regulator protein blaR1
MLENLISNPILSTLALTLIHFLWQGVLIAGALKFMLLLISKQSPLLRYSISCAAMVLCLSIPLITFFWFYQLSSIENNSLGLTQPFTPPINAINGVEQGANITWYSAVKTYLPYLSLVWFTCVLVLTLKLFIELFHVNRLPKANTVPVSDKLQATFHELIERLKLNSQPKLVISLTVKVPMAIGWLKPVVLMPASMLTGLSSSQLEMLLMHELAHIRRHDYLVNLLQTLVEILLFFHPAVMWVSKQIRQEREYCSDDIAVAHSGDAFAYAHTLADTALLCKKHRHATIPSIAMAASGGDLKERVVRLVDHQCTSNNDAGKWLAGTLLGFSLLLIMSKQFITVPQINLTVGEMNLFNLHGKPPKSETAKSANSSNTNLVNTTIAQQLITQQDKLGNTIKLPISSNLMQPHIKVHTPKLVQIDVQHPLTEILKHNSVKNDTVTYTKNSISNEMASLKSDVLENKQTGVAQNESQVIYEEFDVIETKSTKIKANPYAGQIADLAKGIEHTPSLVKAPKNTYTNSTESIDTTVTKKNIRLDRLALPIENLAADDNSSHSEIDVPNKYDAELISATDPKYPSIAKRKGIELDVRVKFTISKDGKIRNITFEDQHKVSYFKNSIISAMDKWYFLPAQLNGHPVESKMSKIFSFNLS